MEWESFTTSTKWDILTALAKQPTSPSQIADILGTTVANVSAQLKLLEAANIIEKQKTGNASAGKPRLLFSILQPSVYITSIQSQNTYKYKISPTLFQQVILNVWKLEEQYHKPLTAFILKHETLMQQPLYVQCAQQVVTLYTTVSCPKTTIDGVTICTKNTTTPQDTVLLSVGGVA
ncbi:MAG: winged helix-turn-helix domain-containing protein [Candidatus Woesearchaeota archaeon]